MTCEACNVSRPLPKDWDYNLEQRIAEKVEYLATGLLKNKDNKNLNSQFSEQQKARDREAAEKQLKEDELLMKQFEERLLSGALSSEGYNIQTFEKVWKLIDFSNESILGFRWEEKDHKKIAESLTRLGFKVRPSKSATLIPFEQTLPNGDLIDGTFFVLDSASTGQHGPCDFGFIDKNARGLVGWLENKYGKSLRLREDSVSENYFDWLAGDVVVSLDVVNETGLASLRFQKWPEYAGMVRGLIASRPK